MQANWKEIARKAIAELQSVAHGERETEMQAIARRIGQKDTSALRRAIFAYQFLERLRAENPTAHEILTGAPLTVVEIIGRWYAFDAFKALSVASEWRDGKGTVRSIAAEMQKARNRGFKGKTGSAFARSFLAAAEPVVIEAITALMKGLQLSPPLKLVRDLPSGQLVDFVFSILSKQGVKTGEVAVLVVGPYTDKKLYSNRRSDWVTKAFGLAWVYDRVVLVLPEQGELAEYRRRCGLIESKADARMPKSSANFYSRVEIVQINVDPFAANDHEALAALAETDAGNFRS